MSNYSLSAIALVLLNGCVVQAPPVPDDPYYAPVMRAHDIPAQANNGSLYRQNVALDLFGDRKAKRIGDILTIVLQENTSANKSANIEITKDNELATTAANGGTVLGTTPGLGNMSLVTDLGMEREFTGESDADQSNSLRGSISVTVIDVYPNGTLLVRGEKWITLNRGDEFIRISGLIRPDDISPSNTVMSTKIANARIQYAGTGEFADAQQMGWASRFFNSAIWPF
ncbi:flagellar basal body L-ring protein FlgH [Agaribacterium haliotis]|uniref:flagellar basal body L-ring protein FlgH n=1 Tax=Agaribacterium haliotis TaxID=2013869 RepID=UPI001EFC8FD6|nr:flagellar basal body L-ring protein FlgH [Agaribacterium haliotis]